MKNYFWMMLIFFSCNEELSKIYIKCLPLDNTYQVNWYIHSLIGGYSGDYIEVYNLKTQKGDVLAFCGGVTDVFMSNDTVFVETHNWSYDVIDGRDTLIYSSNECETYTPSCLSSTGFNFEIIEGGCSCNRNSSRLLKLAEIKRDTCYSMHFVNTDATEFEKERSRKQFEYLKNKIQGRATRY